MNAYNVIKRPIITEKTSIQKENDNQITFEVDKDANRVQIRKAVEEIFKVQVIGVRTAHVRGKFKQRGRIIGKRRDWKKAVVKLTPGQRIDFFEGV
jgi:large subunit ribosomal protein L23